MPPTTPGGKKPQLDTSASGFPGLTPTTASAVTFVSPGSQYDEIQKDEVFALSSIYGEDFHQIETAGAAWKVWLYVDWPVFNPMNTKSFV